MQENGGPSLQCILLRNRNLVLEVCRSVYISWLFGMNVGFQTCFLCLQAEWSHCVDSGSACLVRGAVELVWQPLLSRCFQATDILNHVVRVSNHMKQEQKQNRCIRQGDAEAPRLWLNIAMRILSHVEPERKRKKMGLHIETCQRGDQQICSFGVDGHLLGSISLKDAPGADDGLDRRSGEVGLGAETSKFVVDKHLN